MKAIDPGDPEATLGVECAWPRRISSLQQARLRLNRLRRFKRKRAVVRTVSAVLTLLVLSAGLWQSGDAGTDLMSIGIERVLRH